MDSNRDKNVGTKSNHSGVKRLQQNHQKCHPKFFIKKFTFCPYQTTILSQSLLQPLSRNQELITQKANKGIMVFLDRKYNISYRKLIFDNTSNIEKTKLITARYLII